MRRVLWLIMGVFALGLVGVGSIGLATWSGLVATMLTTTDPLRPADAIVLTYAAGRAGAIRAAELYHAGFGRTLIVSDFSTADVPGVLTDHLRDLYVAELGRHGVPMSVLRFLDRVPTSTAEEAAAVWDVIRREGYRQVIVVGQSYRLRRTTLSLRHLTGPAGVTVLATGVPPPDFDLDRWWQTRQGVSAIANEVPRLVYYFVRGRLD